MSLLRQGLHPGTVFDSRRMGILPGCGSPLNIHSSFLRDAEWPPQGAHHIQACGRGPGERCRSIFLFFSCCPWEGSRCCCCWQATRPCLCKTPALTPSSRSPRGRCCCCRSRYCGSPQETWLSSVASSYNRCFPIRLVLHQHHGRGQQGRLLHAQEPQAAAARVGAEQEDGQASVLGQAAGGGCLHVQGE